MCIGLDPALEHLPPAVRQGIDPEDTPAIAAAVTAFGEKTLAAVEPHTPAVKLQSACFERLGPAGLDAYHRLIAAAQEAGLLVIGDVKRGDIGLTAAHYAAACFEPPAASPGRPPPAAPDAITVNPYFGRDGLQPFLDLAAARDKGLFALVRTSNPGGDAIQALKLADGRTVAEHIAALIAGLGDAPDLLGASGYCLLGAVIGATKPADAARLRRLMPRQLFLVPGFGAQGGGGEDIRPCFHEDGRGAIITASRSVTRAYETDPDRPWPDAIARAAARFHRQVAEAVAR